MKAIQVLVLITFALFLAVIFTFTSAEASTIKIMIIDTGVATTHPALKQYNIIGFSSEDTTFDNMHGTAISSLVMNGILDEGGNAQTPVCSRVQLYVCNYKPFDAASSLIRCLDKAIILKVDFVNYSSTGTTFIPAEYARIAVMSLNNTKFITAAGNEGEDLNLVPKFPAMYSRMDKIQPPLKGYSSLKNVTIVGALTSLGTRWDRSNYGLPMQMEPGVNIRTAFVYVIGNRIVDYGTALVSGTSGSTALYTNKLLRQKCQEVSK